MRETYKLLATDLDGTLLDSNSRLSPENLAALKAARENGVCVVLCSGRSHNSLIGFETSLGLREPGNYGIAFNGVFVYEADTRRVIHSVPMANAAFLFIVRALKTFEASMAFDTTAYIDGELYATRMTPGLLEYANKSRVPYTVLPSFETVTCDVTKILIRGQNAYLTRVYDYMSARADGRFNVFFSFPDLLEFTAPGADKGEGLAFLAGYLGIPLSQCIAVGDFYNDIPMIKKAGLGVAVASADPGVIAAADYVTAATNDQSAIAEVVKKFIL